MKRANGTGSIVRKKGRAKPYIVYSPARFENGKRVIDYLGSFKLKAEAQNFLDEYNRDPTVLRSSMTFAQVYNDFTASKHYEKLSKSTRDGYAAAYKHCAALHSLRFSEIRTVQFQAVIDLLEEKKLSFSSMHKVKVLFTALSKYALQNDVIKKSYAGFVILPDDESESKRALTDIEIQKIRFAAQGTGKTSMGAKWVLYLICSGWRISEMLELTKFNYDEKERTLRGGKKTKNGKNRLVPVYPEVQNIVDEQLEKNGETIFCMEDGKPMTANYFRKAVFSTLLDELKLDPTLTPHNTRHTFATLLKRGGADEFFRKRLLGHASGNVTDDVYTHADLEGLRTAINCLHLPPVTEESKVEKTLELTAV